MLKVREFDLKSGRLLTDYNPETGQQVWRTKNSENSRLEAWLNDRSITPTQANLLTAKFYDGVVEEDIKALSRKGQEFLFAAGEYAYFGKPALARLLLETNPIYQYGEASAHNAVAYGSLIISDGVAQTTTDRGKVKVLVVDNEHRSIGDRPLIDRSGVAIPADRVEKLLDLMGDGTMLVPTATMRQLLLEQEISTAIDRGLTRIKTTPTPELVEQLLSEYQREGRIGGDAAAEIQTEIDRTAKRAVLQFRAALTDTQGIAKGTAKTSQWCEYLGVDAIVSLDDIKGAEKGGSLDRPGLVELDRNLWMNRKDIAQYGQQKVGPQVKYKIPNATLNELNPIALAKALAVAERAVDPYALAQHKIAQVERQLQRPLFTEAGESIFDDRAEEIGRNDEAIEADGYSSAENVAATMKLDKYGQLLQMPTIARQLEKGLRGDWKDAATTGIEIPSAMAQHHGALKPWEVCNKDLPEGAIVAYYRSPLGNVGGMGVGINNRRVLHQNDPESYNKDGVAYMSPWTAKNIAITDFDSDRNGYFVGFVANDPAALIRELRNRFSEISDPAAQYEAGRRAIDRLIQRGTELKLGEYPMAVTEVVEANRPENKPLPISKDKKVLHPLLPGKTISESIAAAWVKTAQNPIGKVADRAMILESLAQNISYSQPAQHQELLQAIVKTFSKIDPAAIPTDERLIAAGLPPLDLPNRIGRVINREVDRPAERLKQATSILEDYAKYPMAKNLQTAVDIAKSNTGIDESFQDFGEELCYQKHALRRDIKSPETYQDRPLNNNTIDPVGQQVAAVNKIYSETPSLSIDRENQNRGYRGFMPELYTERQLAVVNKIVDDYRNLTTALATASTRIKEKNSEDVQPKLVLSSAEGALVVSHLVDAQKMNYFSVVDLHDKEVEFLIVLNKQKYISDKTYEVRNDKNKTIGFVSRESLKSSGLEQLVEKGIAQKIQVKLPVSKIATIAPYLLQNDTDKIHESLNSTLEHLKNIVRGKEEIATSALLHTSTGQGIAPKIFPREIGKYLDRVQTIDIYAASNLTAQNNALIRIDNAKIDDSIKPIASAIDNDGLVTALGITSNNTPTLAPGTVVRGDISATANLDPKLRLTIAPGQKAIGIIPRENFEYQEIPPTSARFEFALVNTDGKTEYQVFAGGKLLGTVEKSSQARVSSIVDREITGEYSRGKFTGKNQNGGLKLNVTALVEHQPVAREMPVASLGIDRNVVWLVPPVHQHLSRIEERIKNYRPNLGEVLRWCGSSDLAGDLAAKEMALGLLQQLRAEFKTSGLEQAPPRDYSSPNAAVSDEIKLQMEAIVRAQATVVAPQVEIQRDIDYER